MTATAHWQNDEKTVLQHTYWGDCRPEDFHNITNETAALFAEAGHNAHLIINLTLTTRAPIGMLSNAIYNHARYASANEVIVIVGANRFLREITDAVDVITPGSRRNVYTANTLAEAQHIIRSAQVLQH